MIMLYINKKTYFGSNILKIKKLIAPFAEENELLAELCLG